MAPPYLIGPGYNVAIIDLDPFVPQPRSDASVRAVQRSEAASGAVHEQGLYIVLQWSVMGRVAIYQALLAQCGLTSVLSAPVTICVPDQQYDFRYYNAIAVRPEQGVDIRRSNYFIGDVSILFKHLVVIP